MDFAELAARASSETSGSRLGPAFPVRDCVSQPTDSKQPVLSKPFADFIETFRRARAIASVLLLMKLGLALAKKG